MTFRFFLHRAVQTIIIFFCLWHMTAVAVYALPAGAKDPLSRTMKKAVLPIVRNYMLLTGQWQQWNLFSPNPLRRVTEYHIQRKTGREWKTVAAIGGQTLHWWNNATEGKILRQLEEKGAVTVPLQKKYLEDACSRYAVPPGISVRLMLRSFVLPQGGSMSAEWWKGTRKWTTSSSPEIRCPSAPIR